ncbi:unnamed protein product [Closterium sp. Yama58-4]|nr:unnamed protein product [Closterium sp. Yama58-4]
MVLLCAQLSQWAPSQGLYSPRPSLFSNPFWSSHFHLLFSGLPSPSHSALSFVAPLFDAFRLRHLPSHPPLSNPLNHQTRKNLQPWQQRINKMASKHHPNLVRLLGYCLDMDTVNERMEQILIYQFMHHGDLEHWVATDAAKTLTLAQRMDVLVGAAHGLEYLHSFGIVHRDIKLANILLDEHMHAKVADFGLVRMGEGTSVYTTRILGTPGYVDPAYSRTRKATTATDVFSFGIVILEVITGRRALVNTSNGNSTIKEWESEPFRQSLLYYCGFW